MSLRIGISIHAFIGRTVNVFGPCNNTKDFHKE